MESPRALIALVLFFPLAMLVVSRYPRAQGVAVAVLAGSLFLPEATLLSIPGLPIIDKERVTYLAVLLGILIAHRQTLLAGRPGSGLELLHVPIFIASVLTLAINQNPMVNDGAIQPALSTRWLFGQTIADVLTFALPYVIGRTMFKTMDDLRVLMRLIVGVGLIYVGLIAIEVLLGIPWHVFQFSHYIYGISIRPQFRWGFTQPVVFMDNGLALATFMAVTLIVAVGLRKAAIDGRWFGLSRVRALLLMGLLMTFNVAASLYGIAMAVALKVLRPKLFLQIPLLVACFVLAYPALRLVDVFPDQILVEIAQQYDADRARSLNGRFLEEDFVIGNLGDRFWFGWGPFSRIPGASDYGADAGEPGLDGWWVINTGMNGLVGTLLGFMFMAIPVLVCWRRGLKFANRTELILIGTMSACIAIRMVDLLINGWWNCLPVFLAGAIMGATSAWRGERGRSIRRRAVRGSASVGAPGVRNSTTQGRS